MKPLRIVLATFGSLGDLHPYLALALELKRRGHHPVLATIEMYREAVEAQGVEFRLFRSALIERPDSELMRKVLDLRNGAEFIIRKLMMPALPTAYADAVEAIKGASLVVSHPMTFAAQLAADKAGMPWVSTQLAPMGYFSAYDPPVLPVAPFLKHLRPLGPALFRPLLGFAKRSVRGWTEPYRALRSELGLPPAGDPMFDGGHSPTLELALFSHVLGERQPDWPSQTKITGFPFYDGSERSLSPGLERFLDAGEPPLVFTLGTSAVLDAGKFYKDSAEAAAMLGKRAVLLVGSDPLNTPENLPSNVAAFDYAPFSLLFPRALAIVHQGGVGTTAQAMRSGRPTVIMPYAVDQPDNAMRVERLGISRTVARTDYSARRAADELGALLEDNRYSERAKIVGVEVANENGSALSCDYIEQLLH
jgi:UDP:flavonoid glycosyltransferase YjiC (YdhE family)